MRAVGRGDSGQGYLRYWGKAAGEAGAQEFHLLAYHCLDVAAVGFLLLERNPALRRRLAQITGLTEAEVVALALFVLALHDIGKFAVGFQDLRHDLACRLRGGHPRRLSSERHDNIGFCFWRRRLALHAVEQEWLRLRAREGELDPHEVREALDPWFAASTGHHGMPPDAAVNDVARFFKGSEEDALAFAGAVVALFGCVEIAWSEQSLSRSSWLFAGLTVLSDWIGSNRDWFPYQAEPMELSEYWRIARQQALRALQETRVMPCAPAWTTCITDLFEHVQCPSPVQELAWSLPLGDAPRLVMIEEVTGGGKTEAALLLAQRALARGDADGVFLALPTMATANAMYGRLKDRVDRFFAPGSEAPRVLSHSARHLAARLLAGPVDSVAAQEEEASASAVGNAWLSDHRKKALLAAFGVGTVDQALLGILHTRHSTLRLYGLCSKVFIADEVHAYDGYTAQLLERLLEFQAALGGSAILLSATLPSAMRQSFANAFARGLGRGAPALEREDYPLVTTLSATSCEEIPSRCRPGTERRVAVGFISGEREALEKLVQVCEAGGCACWVRNSVMDAVEGFRAARERLGARALLFHARLTAGDRFQREAQVLRLFGKESGANERAGRLLVATQVVEQSLDLDFDAMVSDLAPIDLLIQRAGRLHRHPRAADGTPGSSEFRPAPVLEVFAPPFADAPDKEWLSKALRRTSHVYEDHARLWLTMRALREHEAIVIPDKARELVESVYGVDADKRIPEGLRRTATKVQGEKGAARTLAQFNAVNLETGFKDRSGWGEDAEMPTRLGDPTTLLRLARFDGERLVPLYENPLWDFSQVSVRAAYVALRCPVPEVEAAVARAEAEMPDGGKWSLTLPLEWDGKRWSGRALDARGVERSISYSSEEGLLVDDEEE
ncbi:MAG: CRISPR-associated helicase Cas3' [Myxococcales bacterium]